MNDEKTIYAHIYTPDPEDTRADTVSEYAVGKKPEKKSIGVSDKVPRRIIAELYCMEERLTIDRLESFSETSDDWYLYDCLREFAKEAFHGSIPDMIIGVNEVFEHFPVNESKTIEYYLSLATEHYLKWLRGDTDKRYDLVFVWAVMCAIEIFNRKGD